MSDYSITTTFGAKDNLASGDSAKLIKGAEFDTEFVAIVAATTLKAFAADPELSGTMSGTVIIQGGTF